LLSVPNGIQVEKPAHIRTLQLPTRNKRTWDDAPGTSPRPDGMAI
jgi:hypothetical protein